MCRYVASFFFIVFCIFIDQNKYAKTILYLKLQTQHSSQSIAREARGIVNAHAPHSQTTYTLPPRPVCTMFDLRVLALLKIRKKKIELKLVFCYYIVLL